jgi:uncharacterized membrane protein YdjX (TVP38/TMEM64 family)
MIAVLFFLMAETELAKMLGEPEALRQWVEDIGWLGPAALMGLMTLAIVLSPLPSAPIALAAGAAYGHIWGTVYVSIGAETGALAAFAIARFLGGETLQRWFGQKLALGLLGSQRRLMALVFGLRLLPFVSFDVVSYAAGLTPLAAWRFALATLAGIVPISFLLTHFGDRLVGGELDSVALAVLALGLVTGASFYFARSRPGRDD